VRSYGSGKVGQIGECVARKGSRGADWEVSSYTSGKGWTDW
jgi:hypothetical protein